MSILQSHQYNQGIGKYKLLSSTAGVGSIITTKFGTYILVSDINKWHFLNTLNNRIKILLETSTNELYKRIKGEAKNMGLSLIDDQRFVRFIQNEEELDKLECLVAIPQMVLNERFNTVEWTKRINGQIQASHPIAQALNEVNGNGNYGDAKDYQIQGTHFPKWFIGATKNNGKRDFKSIKEWEDIWRNSRNPINAFAPPRDANAPIQNSDGTQRFISYTNANNQQQNIPLFKELTQSNLVLICSNGHLSDIPWSKYLNWRTQKENFQIDRNDNGANLLDFEPCCSNPKLKWSESSTKSEGYASIYIECSNCGLGSGTEDKPKITLEGINSLKPLCKGEKPWEIDLNSQEIPRENCYVNGIKSNGREEMQVALVTANNVYYANGFSSIFIPMHLAEEISEDLWGALDRLQEKYNAAFLRAENSGRTPKTRIEYWDDFDVEGYIYDDEGLTPSNYDEFVQNLRGKFLEENSDENECDFQENYRFQEFNCFANNPLFEGNGDDKGLSFKNIELDEILSEYFVKIQQVDELKITNIQFDFTRVRPKERIVHVDENGERTVEESSVGQNIFSIDKNELYVLPANESFGEGLFFQFNDTLINKWLSENSEALNLRFGHLLTQEIDTNLQGASFKNKIKNNGIKHFLIHSFSHMLMRELEFSCGYPTASLKERLYISNNPNKLMSGVLIYTAEGSEGSMGGLVSQGEPEKILEIIKKGLERSINCSSDPLCWESDGQGLFGLNLSACFSCSLVAETACEEMNLGLDRRVLVDEEFGYFNELILGYPTPN